MPLTVEARRTIERRLAETADLVTVALDELLPRGEGEEGRLTEAMRYAALGPGRRMRPYLALESARLFDAEERSVLRAACALECVHAYAQVHDDLPALDDDDLRRGRPAVHRQYDQATAILVGDALQSAAFEILAHPDTHEDPEVRAALVFRLARAAGAGGLAGGQMLDFLGGGDDPGRAARTRRLKTGALIAYAFEIPLIVARPPEPFRQAIRSFGQDLGLAYRASASQPARSRGRSVGGRPGPGSALAVAPRIEPQERLEMLAAQCKGHLDVFGPEANYLRECVDFVLDRPA